MPDIEDKPYLPSGSIENATSSFSWLGLFGIILVFCVIMFISFSIIKSLKNSNTGIGNSKWLRVLDRQFLGGQHVLYLVEVAGKLQVLGATDRGLVRISEINDMSLAADILEEIANRPMESAAGIIPSVASWLSQRFRKKGIGREFEHFLNGVEDENLS